MEQHSGYVKILGDGNCLFRCFSYLLNGSEDGYSAVKSTLISYIIFNWNNEYGNIIPGVHFAVESAEDYRNFMTRDGEYGAEPEIKAFSDCYNVCVYVYQNEAAIPIMYRPQSYSVILSLHFVGPNDNGHYNIRSIFSNLEGLGIVDDIKQSDFHSTLPITSQVVGEKGGKRKRNLKPKDLKNSIRCKTYRMRKKAKFSFQIVEQVESNNKQKRKFIDTETPAIHNKKYKADSFALADAELKKKFYNNLFGFPCDVT